MPATVLVVYQTLRKIKKELVMKELSGKKTKEKQSAG
jgi:hypothetical protein